MNISESQLYPEQSELWILPRVLREHGTDEQYIFGTTLFASGDKGRRKFWLQRIARHEMALPGQAALVIKSIKLVKVIQSCFNVLEREEEGGGGGRETHSLAWTLARTLMLGRSMKSKSRRSR